MKAIHLGVLALVDGLSSETSDVLTAFQFEKRHNAGANPQTSRSEAEAGLSASATGYAPL
jgi:hypothetical protein